ncbi:MAG: HIT domain-containing protein [Deltaproteobacteria bacterium]|nr:HIT domain-containing protein [Deltaproteobacteria bacterium]
MGLISGTDKPALPSPSGCIFCDYPPPPGAAVDAEWHRARYLICSTPHALLMLNRFPYINGHLLVAPRAHVAQLDELAAEDFAGLHELLRDAIGALRAAYQPHAINVGMNLGEAAGAGIAGHLHYHVVPRWVGDNNFMPVLFDTRVINEALEQTYQRVGAAYGALRGEGEERS